MITATVGRLGKGKTLSGVIDAYEAYLDGKEVFSNIWLDFPHTPIKTPYDFLILEKGEFLADELWHLADNRKSMNLLNNVITIILIRSRKRSFDVFYTQQFLQIDVRISFITDRWIKPDTIPSHQICKQLKVSPDFLVQDIYDADFRKQPRRIIECKEYLSLYDTEKDPYTLSGFVTDKALRKVLNDALEEVNPKELEDLAIKSESVGERKNLLESLS